MSYKVKIFLVNPRKISHICRCGFYSKKWLNKLMKMIYTHTHTHTHAHTHTHTHTHKIKALHNLAGTGNQKQESTVNIIIIIIMKTNKRRETATLLAASEALQNRLCKNI